jgi:hypothetical protein
VELGRRSRHTAFNFEERFFEVNATLIVSVQCFFLILICPEHKVFPCEVIYMIVSFTFTHLEVHTI